MRFLNVGIFLALGVSSVVLETASAQNSNLKSQLATESQSILASRIDLVYRRPMARGRELFGALVPWDRVWSPSADTAARMTVSTPFEVNGTRLPAGTYSLWTIPGATTWTVIFSKQATAFHMRYPDGQDAARIQVTPLKGDHVETLQFSFPMVDADSATFEMRWGTVRVPMLIRIVDSR